MEDLVALQNNQALTTSLKVAEVFEKRHDNIVRDIQKLIKEMASKSNALKIEEVKMFVETTYKDAKGEKRPMYLINRDGFTLLAMGFNGKKALQFKLAYIDAFNKMEQALIKLSNERNFIRDSTKKGYRTLTDSIKANVIPVARANGSRTEDKVFYINAANYLNFAVGCKPYSRDNLSVNQLILLDQLQAIEARAYKQASTLFTSIADINSFVKARLAECAKLFYAEERLSIN